MKKVSAQYTMTRYGLTIGYYLLVTENSGGMCTSSTREPSKSLLADCGMSESRSDGRCGDGFGRDTLQQGDAMALA
jgi:hypothetical protein